MKKTIYVCNICEIPLIETKNTFTITYDEKSKERTISTGIKENGSHICSACVELIAGTFYSYRG